MSNGRRRFSDEAILAAEGACLAEELRGMRLAPRFITGTQNVQKPPARASQLIIRRAVRA